MEAYNEARRSVEMTLTNRRELISERRGGLEIVLIWLRNTNEIQLEMLDTGLDELHTGIVPNDKVLDARDHPYSYLEI